MNSKLSLLLMKLLFVPFWLFISTYCAAQAEFKVYEWPVVASVPADSVFGLRLRKLKLRELPPELAQYKQLKYLDLGQNKVEQLPPFIADFSELKTLDLSRNKLDVFPDILLQLPNLEKLILNRNSISVIPDQIEQMKSLQVLDLWDNPVPDLPENLTALTNLKELHLEGIMYGPNFQEQWRQKLPGVKIYFDPPCDCRE